MASPRTTPPWACAPQAWRWITNGLDEAQAYFIRRLPVTADTRYCLRVQSRSPDDAHTLQLSFLEQLDTSAPARKTDRIEYWRGASAASPSFVIAESG